MELFTKPLSPVEMLIEKTTKNDLENVDWTTVMHISDMINQKPDDCARKAIKLIVERLESGNPHIVSLTLALLESVMKNGTIDTHRNMASAALISKIIDITEGCKGEENRRKSLLMIQDWGINISQFDGNLSIYHDTYARLKLQGIDFPEVPQTEGKHISMEFQDIQLDDNTEHIDKSLAKEFEKLHSDLGVVAEKINERRLLFEQGDSSDTAEDVVDFLRQCQPRMSALIEAGIEGKLDEKTLECCLDVNDQLVRVLDGDMTTGIRSDASVLPEENAILEENRDLFDFDFEEKPSKANHVDTGSYTTMIDSDVNSLSISSRGSKNSNTPTEEQCASRNPTTTGPLSSTSIPQLVLNDDFDSHLERQSPSSK